jgi:AcrR family transcriptional regulator
MNKREQVSGNVGRLAADTKHDRRTLRTQEVLIHSLLDLIESTPYDLITVGDIINRANVGRSTFYSHYRNKDDLLTGGFEHVLDLLVRQITVNNENQLVFDTSMLFRHAREHKDIYRKLVWGSGFKLLIKDGHDALSRKIEERLSSLGPMPQPPAIPPPILAHSVSGLLLVLLKWWLDKGLPYPPERMDEIFQHLIMGSMRDVLGYRSPTIR